MLQGWYKGHLSQTGTFNFTGIKRNASVAVLLMVVSGKYALITDRQRTCCGPAQRPLIKMADNSVSAVVVSHMWRSKFCYAICCSKNHLYIFIEKTYNVRIILPMFSVIKHTAINEVSSAKNPDFSSLVYILQDSAYILVILQSLQWYTKSHFN
jgi:hypothetical protein